MAELFGFRFEKVKDVGGEKFTLPAADDGTVEVAGGGFYGQVLDTDGRDRTEQDLVRRYRDIAQQPECDSAIEDIVNEVNTIPVVFGKKKTQALVLLCLIASSYMFGTHPHYYDRPLINSGFEIQNGLISIITFLL